MLFDDACQRIVRRCSISNNVPTIWQRCGMWKISICCCIDACGRSCWVTTGIVSPSHDVGRTVHPRNDITAPNQSFNRRCNYTGRLLTADSYFATDFCSCSIKLLRSNREGRTRITSVLSPGYYKTAITQLGNRLVHLIARRRGIDSDRRTHFTDVGVIQLDKNIWVC